MRIKWYCTGCRRVFGDESGDAPDCFRCQGSGTDYSVVTRCARCFKVVRVTEGRACGTCADAVRKQADRLLPRLTPLSAVEFRRLWAHRWSDSGFNLDTQPDRVDELCEQYDPGHLRSAIRSNRSLGDIKRWCRALAEGRNPGGATSEGGFSAYGTFRCPNCGKIGGCSCRIGGGL